MSDFSMAELREMAPAYVLGALSEAERAAFEAALLHSSELVQEVASFRAVIERIGTEQELAPPPALRARFLDSISAEKRAPAVAAEPARPFVVSTGKAGAPQPRTVARERLWVTGVLTTALAASVILGVQRNSEVRALKAMLAERDSVLKVRELTLSQRDSTLNTVLEAERDLVVVNLASTPTGPGMQFFWNVKQGRGLLHAFRLKPAAAGRAYQLWLIKDGKPVPSRVFNAEADEHGLAWGIDLPTQTSGVTAVAVTEEPAGGSPQPTTKPFMVGELPKAAQ